MNPQVLLAIQLLTKTITDLPLAIQTVMAGAAVAPPSGQSWTGQRPGTAPAQGSGPDVTRVYVTNSNWAEPVPVRIVGGGGPSAPKEKEGLGLPSLSLPGLGLITAKFAAVAGPLAILSAALGSTVSGMQTLGVAVKTLGGAIAPLLLPAAILLSTALVALSDVVLGTLMPGLEGFFGLLIGLGVPALAMFIDAVIEGTKRVKEWAEYLVGPRGGRSDAEIASDTVRDFINSLAPGLGGLSRETGKLVAETEDLRPERGGGSDLVLDALRDVMGSLRLSVGPKAQISGLESVGKAAQLAAFAQDPLEARMFRVQQQIFALLQRAVDTVTASRGVWYPGDGAFGGGSGAEFAGGDF